MANGGDGAAGCVGAFGGLTARLNSLRKKSYEEEKPSLSG
jgi:hypothetical protein